MTADWAAHVALEPGVDTARMETVFAVSNRADLAAYWKNILANRAHLPLRGVDFNDGIL